MSETTVDPGTAPAPRASATGPRSRRRSRSCGELALDHIGRAALLSLAVLRSLRRPGNWMAAAAAELHRQAFDTLGMALTLAALGGALISQQTGYQFQGTLPPWVVGSVVAASVVTELAPLFVGFALIGTVGTRITAEISAMQVTEQIDALEVMGRDPVMYLVVPRVTAAMFAGPLIMALALATSMLAGWMVALVTTRADTPDFWFGVRHYMRDFPPFYALIKATAFSVAITFIACYTALDAGGGSTGVGRTARRAVIAMIAAVIVLDTALVPLLKVIRI